MSAGGVRNGSGHLEYGNTLVLSADRNGSTAFMQDLKTNLNLNGDFEIFLGECFSQDSKKNQPPSWWDPEGVPPSKVVDYINRGTGKSVILKLQITWPTFNNTYFNINATRRIFFHRNLFDSTLSRCIALRTGRWFTHRDETPETSINTITIPEDFFTIRLEYRIEQYIKNMQYIQNWCNEWYRYETYNYCKNLIIIPNLDKNLVVNNYQKLKSIYNTYYEINEIENMINEKIK